MNLKRQYQHIDRFHGGSGLSAEEKEKKQHL
jgi:hypothetical protein